tara:strand:- start:263 stop:634 length:372 start_codon:yes stop_codon:yes gene_type:complete
MSTYKQDPNNIKKQIPNTSLSAVDGDLNMTTLPSAKVVQKRPNSVILNKVGTYGFMYETTSSLGATVAYATSGDGTAETFVSGGAIIADTAGPVELPIQPVAWVRDNNLGDGGDVIFVYKGVK